MRYAIYFTFIVVLLNSARFPLLVDMENDRVSDFVKIAGSFTVDRWTIISAGIFVVLTIIYFIISVKRRKLPPGPVNLPILGYYPFLRKDPIKVIHKLGKKYGDIFGFYMGSQYVVVSNDWTTATELLSKALDRPPTLFKDVPYNFGIVGISGTEWLEARRMTSKAMKDIGLHRTYWEHLVQEETSDIVEGLLNYNGRPVDIKEFFSKTFVNNILTLVLGYKLPSDSELVGLMGKYVDTIMENTPSMGLVNYSKPLVKFMQLLGIEKQMSLKDELRKLDELVSQIVDNKLHHSKSETEDSFIDQIHQTLNERPKHTKLEENLKEDLIKGNVIALLAGGSETSRTALVWLLIAIAENPEVQQKVHEELDRVLGKDGSIIWAQRKNVPYTHAAILEGMRWKTISTHNVLRITSEDVEVRGYIIPKDTFIAVNVQGLHNDPKYWTQPEKFMPERFLSEDGKGVNTSPDSYLPFSYGKRNCPGKLIAYMSLLQYFTVLMQKFRVTPKEGKIVQHGVISGISYQACNAEICFIPRQ